MFLKGVLSWHWKTKLALVIVPMCLNICGRYEGNDSNSIPAYRHIRPLVYDLPESACRLTLNTVPGKLYSCYRSKSFKQDIEASYPLSVSRNLGLQIVRVAMKMHS